MGDNNFWQTANFSVGYSSHLHKVAQFSTSIEEMNVVTLNYWLKVCDSGGQEVRRGPHE